MKYCRICLLDGEMREGIEKLISDGLTYREIARKHLSYFSGSNLHLIEQSIRLHHLKHIEKELTIEDRKLLDRFERGEVSLEETSNIVAAKAFEHILKNPSDVRFVDFFRAELLKLKQQELKNRDNWGNELIARLFAGKLPPRFCRYCGEPFIEGDSLENKKETVKDLRLLNG